MGEDPDWALAFLRQYLQQVLQAHGDTEAVVLIIKGWSIRDWLIRSVVVSVTAILVLGVAIYGMSWLGVS